jgi:hypothetical protein
MAPRPPNAGPCRNKTLFVPSGGLSLESAQPVFSSDREDARGDRLPRKGADGCFQRSSTPRHDRRSPVTIWRRPTKHRGGGCRSQEIILRGAWEYPCILPERS